MASEAQRDITLNVRTELCAYSHATRHDCWALANVKAPLYEPEARVPVDVVAVIDVSGSMAGEKLNLVKKTLLFVIGQCTLVLGQVIFPPQYIVPCMGKRKCFAWQAREMGGGFQENNLSLMTIFGHAE